MGRPSIKTPEIVDAVCEAVAQGTPLVQACRNSVISKDAWNDWVNADDDLKRRFARAREDGHDAIASRTRETARGKGAEQGGDSTGDVQRDKLIIETDLKLLAKWDRRYGDKMLVGSDPENPLPSPLDMSGLSTAALKELAKLAPNS
jgi:hypothetical protein